MSKIMKLFLGMNTFRLITVYYIATHSDSPPYQDQ